MRNLFTLMFIFFIMFFTPPAFAQDDAVEAATPEVVDVEAPVVAAPDAEAGDAVEAEATELVVKVIEGGPLEVVEAEVVEPIEDATVPLTDEEAGVLLGQIFEAAQQGHWMIFSGGLFLLLVWVFNKLGLAAKIGRNAVPYVTVAISTLTMVAIGLATGDNLVDALMTGLVDGGIAIALWELIAKKLTSLKSDGEPRNVLA